MEELNLITLNAINGYYNHLNSLGYIDCYETDNMIILSFINDILNTAETLNKNLMTECEKKVII